MAIWNVSENSGVVLSPDDDVDVSAADAAPAITEILILRTAPKAARFMSIKGIRFSLKFKRGPLAPVMTVRPMINPRQ